MLPHPTTKPTPKYIISFFADFRSFKNCYFILFAGRCAVVYEENSSFIVFIVKMLHKIPLSNNCFVIFHCDLFGPILYNI